MALPSNVVGLMGIDNSGNVVTLPVDLFTTTQTIVPEVAAVAPAPPSRAATANIITNNTTETIELEIDADENYLVKVNSTKDNFDNSVLYESNKRIGLNNKSPQFGLDVHLNSINITNLTSNFGYKLNGRNFAYTIGDAASTKYGNIYLGDIVLQTIVAPYLVVAKTAITPTPAIIYKRPLYVDDTGLVAAYAAFTEGSIIFSSETELTQNNTRLFWDNTNFRLGILTKTPAYSFDVNGTARIQTSLITPTIGNTLGVAANNTWTFASNVNIPLVPVDASHAASKQYVDNTALTGLKLGAEVKTVAVSNVGLSGLASVGGYTPVAGDRILVIGQSNQSENGVYNAASGGWSRATDSDSDAELRGYQYLITAGTFINARYGNTNQSTITVGTTAITYQTISAGESDPIFTASPSFAITNTNISNWTTAYNRSIVSSAFSGTDTQTLTLTKQDGGTLTSSFTFPVTSVFGRTGGITLTSGDVTSALGYTPYNGATNSNGYISSINSSAVTSALGYTPVSTTRTITINGLAQDLSQDRTWTIAAGITSFNGATGAIIFGETQIIAQLGYVPVRETRTITINGITRDLSGNISFSTLSSFAATSNNGISIVAATGTTGAVTLSVGALADNMRLNSLRVGTFTTLPPTTSGNIYAAGDIVGFSTSDERLKEKIEVIENATDKLSRIRGVKFNWKKEFQSLHGFEGADMGVIAQDVLAEFPEAITTRDTGYLAVRYEKLIGLLIAAVNEQSEEIKELKSKLK